MNQALRNELLNRGLSDMLQLDEMASVARRHLGGSPSEADVMGATTEVIGELLSPGYAIVGDVVRDEGLLCVQSWGWAAPRQSDGSKTSGVPLDILRTSARCAGLN
jgi:hypothetical protein